MGKIRTASWFPFLSVLLMAVFVQAQAAGCCKLGSSILSKVSAVSSASSSVTPGLPQAGASLPEAFPPRPTPAVPKGGL